MALGAGLMFGPAQAAPPVQCAVATIQVEPGAAGITLTGRAVALARCQFTASLTVERSGQSGHIKTKQGGEFAVEKGRVAEIATLAISMTPEDSLAVELTLSFAGRQIATSSLRVGP